MRRLAVVFALLLASAAAGAEPKVRGANVPWQASWIARADVRATLGDVPVAVYQDPAFPRVLVLIDKDLCWIVDTEQKVVASAGCGVFDITPSSVRLREPAADLADVYWLDDGRLVGYEWADVMADCGAWLSRFFRRPAFTAGGVSFGGCDRAGDVTIETSR